MSSNAFGQWIINQILKELKKENKELENLREIVENAKGLRSRCCSLEICEFCKTVELESTQYESICSCKCCGKGLCMSCATFEYDDCSCEGGYDILPRLKSGVSIPLSPLSSSQSEFQFASNKWIFNLETF